MTAKDSPRGSGAHVRRKKPVRRLGDTKADKDRGAKLFAIIAAKRCRRLMGYHPGAAGDGPGARAIPRDKNPPAALADIPPPLPPPSPSPIVPSPYPHQA